MNLVTSLDFDGLVCAAMIHDMENITNIEFSSPKTMEDGGLLGILSPGDVIAHLPLHPDAGIWFHNHDTSHIEPTLLARVRGKFGVAPSASRQVYDYYNDQKLARYEPLVNVADMVGNATITQDDVFNPTGWSMVSCTLDHRFSRDHSYGMLVLNAIKAGKTAQDILAMQPVARRVELYQKDEASFLVELKAHTKLYGKVILTDFRELMSPPRGNRFRAFFEYPDGNVHVRVEALPGFRTKVSVSKSITNRTCNVNIGKLMEEYGGGGMEGAGTCMMGKKVADERIAEIVKALQA
ncbi:hypothetical protein K9N50_03645 [bacterium]|nr:hypothetical protein [bacterium]